MIIYKKATMGFGIFMLVVLVVVASALFPAPAMEAVNTLKQFLNTINLGAGTIWTYGVEKPSVFVSELLQEFII